MAALVSILIPAYNAEKWIKQTLKSALSQDYPNTEVILVDDGSTDQTLRIAKSFQSGSVKVINQPNAGGPAARNKGLEHAQGDYIQWLDHDDLLAPNKISAQLQSLERVPNDKILCSCPFATFYYRIEKARLFDSPLYRDLTPLEYFFIKFSMNTYFQSACWLVSRKLTELAGPWWEIRSPDDDGEYFCRVVRASENIQFVPQAKCYWRVGNAGSFCWAWRKSRNASESTFKSMYRCIEHFRSLEDSDRSRAACVRFLQDRMIYFYPDRPNILDRMYALATELGGSLHAPRLRRKYRGIERVFGYELAKRAQLSLPELRYDLIKLWDKALFCLKDRTLEIVEETSTARV
jgi:glycosyltransferase involved in cell wall biosynthesis